VVGQQDASHDIWALASNVASMLATSSSIRISGNGDAQRWLREVTTEVLTDCFEHQKALAEIRRQQLAENRMPLGVATEGVLRFEWKIPPPVRFRTSPIIGAFCILRAIRITRNKSLERRCVKGIKAHFLVVKGSIFH
jgi:hypothetical protein